MSAIEELTTHTRGNRRKVVMLPLPGRGLSLPAQPLRSTARMVGETWVITSQTEPAVTTTGPWLESVIRQHRHDVDAGAAILEIEYAPVPAPLRRQLTRLRQEDEQIRKLRWVLTQREQGRRSKRTELIEELTKLELLPSEIAEMMNLPLSAIVRDTGSESESRLARGLLRRARSLA